MLDIKFIRENPDAVRENIKKKFQDAKLPLVDEVLDLDSKRRAAIAEADQLRSNRNTLSKQIGNYRRSPRFSGLYRSHCRRRNVIQHHLLDFRFPPYGDERHDLAGLRAT